MSKAAVGQQVTVDNHQLVVVISYVEDEHAMAFNAVDGLDYDNENDRLVACTFRGMIALASAKPEEVANIGANCFVEEGIMTETGTQNGDANTTVDQLVKLDVKGHA